MLFVFLCENVRALNRKIVMWYIYFLFQCQRHENGQYKRINTSFYEMLGRHFTLDFPNAYCSFFPDSVSSLPEALTKSRIHIHFSLDTLTTTSSKTSMCGHENWHLEKKILPLSPQGALRPRQFGAPRQLPTLPVPKSSTLFRRRHRRENQSSNIRSQMLSFHKIHTWIHLH